MFSNIKSDPKKRMERMRLTQDSWNDFAFSKEICSEHNITGRSFSGNSSIIDFWQSCKYALGSVGPLSDS